jgi:hypothetical protein
MYEAALLVTHPIKELERVPVQFRLLLEQCLEKDLTTWLGRFIM